MLCTFIFLIYVNLEAVVSYPIASDVSGFFTNLDWSVSENKTPASLEYMISKEFRTVRVIWYKTKPQEFWFSLHECERCDLISWVEMSESELFVDVFRHIEIIVMRYLEKPTKTFKFLGLFGKGTLKYKDDGQWYDICLSPCDD